jgi:hypothetical protein
MFTVYNILEANVSSYHPSTHCGNRILDSEDTFAFTSPAGRNFINLAAVGYGPLWGTVVLEFLSKFLLYSKFVIYPVVKKLIFDEIKEA